MKEMKKIINPRYLTILLGILLRLIVIIANWEIEILLGLILFAIWNLLPNILYFIISRKSHSLIRIAIPAILLCLAQLFFVLSYFTATETFSGLFLMIAPIIEIPILIVGFLLGYSLEKFLEERN